MQQLNICYILYMISKIQPQQRPSSKHCIQTRRYTYMIIYIYIYTLYIIYYILPHEDMYIHRI